jgi:ABC-type phosphate transport system substrate-binding protein
MDRRIRALVVCATALVSLGVTRPAAATTPNCTSLPNPIIISGSTAVKPYIAQLSYAMSQETPTAYTLIYSGPGSCGGVTQLIGDDGASSCSSQSATGACVSGSGTYYTAPASGSSTPTSNTCTFDTGGDHVDVAVSDVFLDTCATMNSQDTTGFTDNPGFVESMTWVVPSGATGQQAITAAEAYFVIGFPNADGITGTDTPWQNDQDIFVRNANSGTQIIMSGAIGVPANKWYECPSTTPLCSSMEQSESGSGGVASGLEGLTGSNIAEGLGILGIDYVEGNPTNALKILAFKQFGQDFAYYPDSTSTALDKQNVRDGHYGLWGYAHFITRDGETAGTPTANGLAVLNALTGTTSISGFNPQQAIIKSYYIPQCAMTVSRSADNFSSIAPYSDPAPCDCYFVATATGTAPSSCTACTSNSTCSGGVCRQGYCEPR